MYASLLPSSSMSYDPSFCLGLAHSGPEPDLPCKMRQLGSVVTACNHMSVILVSHTYASWSLPSVSLQLSMHAGEYSEA